jgi:hypothetical protein
MGYQFATGVLADHETDQLQDDASIVILEWHTGTERKLLP